MGVTGLWEVVQPCARPIKIDTLNKKRLAIDASIWVYHFLKAVRDKEGNALRNSHVVGFYRRICKLLFFGIKPIFVFDGGAPVLKRQTITGRKARREGRREDATRTAGKLLALQMQRAAEEEEERQRRDAETAPQYDTEEAVPENPVYVDELQMTQQERQQTRRFRKKDQYHLPDLSMPLGEMGGQNDPRVMSIEELQQYAKQFETAEDINVYDFSKIDFDSPFFTSLPASDRYNILNAARLRSRLRMGYSKDQLDTMFPNRMEFSRFQIERVRERNELTTRLMQVGSSEDGMFLNDSGRVAGERGREYVLVKNPDVEGGWALGVIGGEEQEEGQREKPIDLEERARQAAQKKAEDERELTSSESEGDFGVSEEIQKRREAFYESRKERVELNAQQERQQSITQEDENSLFVAERQSAPKPVASAEDSEDEEAQLQIALAMSLENGEDEPPPGKRLEPKLPKQRKAVESAPFANSKGPIASVANARAHRAAPENSAVNNFVEESSGEEDSMDLQGALAESRQSKYRPKSPQKSPVREEATEQKSQPAKNSAIQVQKKFAGPLPFEKLDLGSSLLGKKKMKQLEEADAGGFVKDDRRMSEDAPAKPAPPWFSADVQKGIESQRQRDVEDQKRARQEEDDAMFRAPRSRLRKDDTTDVIDVDALAEGQKNIMTIDSSEDDEVQGSQVSEPLAVVEEDSEIRMGDMADRVRAEPPKDKDDTFIPSPANEHSEADAEGLIEKHDPNDFSVKKSQQSDQPSHVSRLPENGTIPPINEDERSGDELEWEVSDVDEVPPLKRRKVSVPEPNAADGAEQSFVNCQLSSQNGLSVPHDATTGTLPDAPQAQRSYTPDLGLNLGSATPGTLNADDDEVDNIANQGQEDGRSSSPDDVYVPDEATIAAMAAEVASSAASSHDSSPDPIPMSGTANQSLTPHPVNMPDEDLPFSDDEDEELMVQLAAEAEEHARFTSTFNNKTTRQNIEDYERELKALRSQQKKDRRDADEVTTVMIQECQQLLKLFGLPYITAPMEAEAQCAELVALGLVDGIVTDDSDIFLFGGTRVYKNMFNQAKFVECYLASDLERDFDLTRKKMIAIAHLLGSDYTEGLAGVGPVTALEILTEFPEGLDGFRDWFAGLQQGNQLTDEDKKNNFKKKFKKQATKLILPTSFPDKRVDLAYLKPEVDSDPSAFQWGVPDLDALRSFLMATIGWTPDRTDEVLVPVIRDMNRRENEGTQANITAFLGGHATTGAGAFAPRVRAEGKSKRMEAALERMAERARARRKGGVGDANEEQVIATSGSGVDGSAGVTVAPRRQKEEQQRHRVANGKDGDGHGGNSDGELEDEPQKKSKRKGKGKATKRRRRRE